MCDLPNRSKSEFFTPGRLACAAGALSAFACSTLVPPVKAHAGLTFALVVIGSGLLIAAVLVPTVQQFEIGLPVGIRITAAVRDRNTELKNTFESERAELELCAQLLSDDPEAAATLVEAAWSQTVASWRRPVSPAIRMYALCTLVHLLVERDRLHLLGSTTRPSSSPLSCLAFSAQVLIVLHSFVGLSTGEIANLLSRAPQDVERELQLAESTLALHVPDRGKSHG